VKLVTGAWPRRRLPELVLSVRRHSDVDDYGGSEVPKNFVVTWIDSESPEGSPLRQVRTIDHWRD